MQAFLTQTENSMWSSHWSDLSCMRSPMKMTSILKPSALIRCEGLMVGDIGYGGLRETGAPPTCPFVPFWTDFGVFQSFQLYRFHHRATWPVEVATRWHVVYLESFLQLPHGDKNWWNTSEVLVCMSISRAAMFGNMLQAIQQNSDDWDFVALSHGLSTCHPRPTK